MPDDLLEKQQHSLEGEKIELTAEHTGADPRTIVANKYREILETRKSNPDRVTYAGEDLAVHDSDLIVLDLEKGEHPRLWSIKSKWAATMIVGGYVFLAPFTSTIFAPCLPAIMAAIGVTDPIQGALQVSVFLFPFSISPLILAPLSEIYGRKPVLSAGNFVFIAFSVGSGFCNTAGSLAACRFFAGAGGSACLAVFGGVLADIWDLKERARASGILGGTIIMGPVLGPVCGGWIAQTISWRWTCWIPAMAAAVLEILAFLFFQECFIPVLLRRKLTRSRKVRPEDRLYTILDLQEDNQPIRRPAKHVVDQCIRPMVYLTDPALALLSVYYSFVFGVLYLVIVTFYTVFGNGYGHSPGIVGVDLLAEGIGALLGLPVTVKLMELVYARATQSKEEYKSETRLITAFGGALITSAGLFIYGFTALRTHFIVPLIGVAIFALGTINTYMAIQLYIIDSFDFPASAMAAFSFLRMVFAGAFPLFGNRLFDSLGIDWGVGLLAFLSLGLGVPFLPIIYRFGPALRELGKRNRARWGR